MIASIFHEGSGLGDQLFRYITVRTLAEEKGYEWGMFNGSNFKGKEFLKIKPIQNPIMSNDLVDIEGAKRWLEKETRENGIDIRSYDPEINFVEDNTILDGSFEDSKYWEHNLANINKWLEVEPLEVPDDLCILGFRGGEYYADPALGLPKEYYDEAIAKMRELNPNMRFQVHTDDTELAKQFFAIELWRNAITFEVIDNPKISHSKNANMGFNWRSARFARYAIIPNSAFFIIPRMLRHLNVKWSEEIKEGFLIKNIEKPITIAPRYWARREKKTWARPACYYKQFTYI